MSTIAGAALIGLGPHPAGPEPDALSPYSLAAYLRRAAGPDAREIRVNGVYGSGHYGAWQFAAHLTWRTRDGAVQGGEVTLPGLLGSPLLASPFSTQRLVQEQHHGWTLARLDHVLDHLRDTAAPLALVNVEIPANDPGRVVACHSPDVGNGDCQAFDEGAHRECVWSEELLNLPYLDAISVQRQTAPITS